MEKANAQAHRTQAAREQARVDLERTIMRSPMDINVREADIGSLAVSQGAPFTVDAYRGQVMRGTVREIRSAPIVVQNVVHDNAIIAFDNPDATHSGAFRR